MAKKYNFKVGDLSIEARFEAPAFVALRQEGLKLVELLYTKLAPFGMDLTNITFGQTGSMADRHIYFNLPVLNAGVKLNVGRMDVGFNDMNRANFDAINRVLHAAYGALDEGNVGAKIASYAITVNSHGSIEGTTGAEFVKPFFGRAPAGLGPTLGSGGVFYFGAHERRTGLAVVMEASSLVTDGLYTRLIFTLDGTRVRYQDVAEAGRETIRHALGAMDLQLENL